MMVDSPALDIADVSHRFGSRAALSHVSLRVERGDFTALLGPNGAGKTTTVKVLTTLTRPDEGSARIAGIDVLADPRATRRVIGVSGQYAAVDENLTGFENLDMIGRLYHLGRRESQRRAHDLIDMFELTAAGDRPVKGFSGGMRRRIDLAGALVTDPEVLFLDEPTTGLDPRSRLALWEVITDLVTKGTTVLLTTQYLEEADQLADDISVIDDGKVIAEGTSDQLKAQVGGHRVVVSLTNADDREVATSILARHGDSIPVVSSDGRTIDVAVTDGPSALQGVLGELGSADIDLHDAGMRRPTLDDVFLQLTGRSTEMDDGDDDSSAKTKKAKKRKKEAA